MMTSRLPGLHMGGREWTLLIALSVLWGGSFFFTEIVLEELPPFTVVLGRVGIAALALHVVLAATGRAMPTDGRLWLAFLGMGLLNNLIPFCLIVWSQTRITSGLAAILNATTPLWTVLLAHALTSDEGMTPRRLLGLLCGFGGVVVMIGPAALGGLGLDVVAQLAVLAGAVSYACAGVFGRRFRRVDPMTTAAGQLTASTLLILPLALAVDQPWQPALPGPRTWSALLGFALLSTALAYVLYFRILAGAGATNLLLVTFLIPVSALLLGTGVLGEAITLWQLFGMALIGLSLATIDGRLVGRLRGRSARAPRPSIAGSSKHRDA